MSQTPPQSPARVEDEDESDDDTVFLDYINQLQSESEDEQVDDELIQAYLDHEQYEHENEDDFEEEESETVRDHLDQNMPTWLQNLQALPSPPNTPKRNRVKNITFKGHEEPLKAIVYGTKTVTEETAVTDPNEQELLVVRAEEETACPFSGATANTNEGFRDFLLQYGLLYRSGYTQKPLWKGRPRCQAIAASTQRQCRMICNRTSILTCCIHEERMTRLYSNVLQGKASLNRCPGITKLKKSCKFLRGTCPWHGAIRRDTLGDVFRSEVQRRRGNQWTHGEKPIFIPDREVIVDLVEGCPTVPQFSSRPNLESSLFPGAAAHDVHECVRLFVAEVQSITRTYAPLMREYLYQIIHDVFSNFEKDIETLPLGERSRSFQTGWIYYLIFEPTSYQHYELSQELIENNSVVIKNGVTSCKEARFNRHREDCGIDKAPLYIFPSKTDDTNDEGVPFAWLLESIMHGYARGQQYSFQCKCRTLHTEMFLYRRLGEESKEKAMEAVVVYLTPVINDWIKALRILRPLQIHLMNRVHKIDQS